MVAAKKRGLGRGLDALLGDGDVALAAVMAQHNGQLRLLPIEQIVPGQYQPRQYLDEAALDALAASIKSQGLIQPLVVRPIDQDRFELIAGERRWRAAARAHLQQVPVLLKDVPDVVASALALIENIQREDLRPLEEAAAMLRLVDDFSMTHQQVAEAVGRSRSAVSNLLRLLELPASIRQLLDEGSLEMGHVRCLLTLDEALALPLARQAALLGWSVRELEAAVRKSQTDSRVKTRKIPRDSNVEALERELAARFATRVDLAQGRTGRGKLVIHFHSNDELEGILGKLR